MKPITLAISGLHSFREKQVIDFNTLCEGGIFGIFGPTGSGKSSILDAMTLALYGKVERASNNTHGILNHAEEQLTVSFTFELVNGSVQKRYTVERVFKRADEMRVKATISHLIEVGEETIVLADKAGEVTEHVYNLLGLTIDDFTRAVVLPQGKFAEFLSLKGTERRQMLQRLFHLEQYGDQLIKKLKKKTTEAKSKRNECVAEQIGLGDASIEAVEEANKERANTELLLQKRSKEYEAVTKEFESKQEIWQLQSEKQTYEMQKQELQTGQAQITSLQEQFAQAEEAESLRPYAEAVQITSIEKDETEKMRIDYHKQYIELKDHYEKINKSYEIIREEKSSQEPVLVIKREKLLTLKQVEDELNMMIEQVKSLQSAQVTLAGKRGQLTHQLDTNKQALNKYVTKQTALKDELTENIISVKERQQVRDAQDAKHKVMQVLNDFNEVSDFTSKKGTLLSEYKVQMNQLTKKSITFRKQLLEYFQLIQRHYGIVSERDLEHEHFLIKAKQQLEITVSLEDKDKEQQLAKELVKQLTAGERCPVCGSTDHPHPAEDRNENHSNRTKSAYFKDFIEQQQVIKQDAYSLKHKLQSLAQQLSDEFPFLNEAKSPIEALVKPLLSGLNEQETQLYFEEGHKRFSVEYKSIAQDLLGLKEQIDKTSILLRNTANEDVKLQHSISLAEQELSDLVEKQGKLDQEYKVSESNYHKEFPAIPLEKIEELLKSIFERDQAAEQISARVQKSVSIIENQTEMVRELEEQKTILAQEEVKLNSELENREQQVGEKREKLKEVEGTLSIGEQIKEIEERLSALIAQEKTLYASWQKSSKELHQVANDLAASEKSYENAVVRHQKALEKWGNISKNSTFQTIENLLASLQTSQERQAMKMKIDTYLDKRKQIDADLKRIESKLNNQSLANEQWQHIGQIKQELKGFVDAAVEARGAAGKALSTLLEKHERFMIIEKQRETLDESIQHLDKLQAVFKGNGFVEFIAEEQLQQVSRDATERLGLLTRQRYAIEVDSQGGFIMRDDANGGVRRPVSTLSGGETFLTSLALALSLSTQIQLRGEFPLQFFFLDEGFGTLDADLLDTVVSALEKLHSTDLSVGVISHVQELRARLPRRLIVQSAEPSGKGSSVYLETL
ncbi:AAA family ATPase [Metabacillus herbersteinensis]|uniref:Nuclease SbcCD subunit C n=1 Tax=Metabacillus herbersteinensis TaxID=283816 RepID=A0ABV6GLJ8_9BACI